MVTSAASGTPTTSAVTPVPSNTTTQSPQVAAKPVDTPSKPPESSTPVAPVAPAASAAQPPAPAVSQPMSREDKIAALCIKTFLVVEEIIGGLYSHRGVCKKCGWQSMQHSSGAAYDIVRGHVMNHWKDVAAQVDAA